MTSIFSRKTTLEEPGFCKLSLLFLCGGPILVVVAVVLLEVVVVPVVVDDVVVDVVLVVVLVVVVRTVVDVLVEVAVVVDVEPNRIRGPGNLCKIYRVSVKLCCRFVNCICFHWKNERKPKN